MSGHQSILEDMLENPFGHHQDLPLGVCSGLLQRALVGLCGGGVEEQGRRGSQLRDSLGSGPPPGGNG
jgi:hypothetical protein